MKSALALVVVLLTGCVSFYRSYNFDIYRVSDDLSYVSVYFWGQQFVPGWEGKAEEAAKKMVAHEAARNHLLGEITLDGRPQPWEGSGISINAFVGRALSPEEAMRIKKMIDYRSPTFRGKAKITEAN